MPIIKITFKNSRHDGTATNSKEHVYDVHTIITYTCITYIDCIATMRLNMNTSSNKRLIKSKVKVKTKYTYVYLLTRC